MGRGEEKERERSVKFLLLFCFKQNLRIYEISATLGGRSDVLKPLNGQGANCFDLSGEETWDELFGV